ncbi:MAG: hypothetical protein ABH896_03475 [Candidatus Jacksonbacteria bacterium]
MKISLKTILFIIIIIALSLTSILFAIKAEKVEKSAAILVQIAEIKSNLSSYLAEQGAYPNTLEQLQNIGGFAYYSSGSGYQIEFSLPAALGAFKTKGWHCATEKSTTAGKCPAPADSAGGGQN